MSRPYNSTPLLEDDGPDLIECPTCQGRGRMSIYTCPRCNGDGTIEDDGGSDEYDAACDEAHERAVDREAGLP